MPYSFGIGGHSPPSLTGSNSNDFVLEENRLCSFQGLPQTKRRRISLEQDQNANRAISFPADTPPTFMDDLYVSSMEPSELLFSPSAMSCHALVDTDDDCISGALSHARKRISSSLLQHNDKTLLGNQISVKSCRHRQLFADNLVQNSIENLQLLHDKMISNMVALDTDGCGDSKGLPQCEERNNLSPKHHPSTKFEDSVSNFQVSNRRRRFSVGRLNVECSVNPIAASVAHDKSRDEGSWHWRSQTTQECLTETFTAESPVSQVEEGADSDCNGGKRSTSRRDLEELLSSLQALLSVLKKHEENEHILRAKMQVLRERKRALHEEKQQYKRQRDSECRSPLSQEPVHVCLAERG